MFQSKALKLAFAKQTTISTAFACVGQAVACDRRAMCKAACRDDLSHLLAPDQLANGSRCQDEDASDTMRFSKFVSSYLYYCQHSRRFWERSDDRQQHIEELRHLFRGVVQVVTSQVWRRHKSLIHWHDKSYEQGLPYMVAGHDMLPTSYAGFCL